VLILLPPSEGKTAARRGRPLDLGSLSFPELTPMRDDLIEVVARASGEPEGHEVIGVNPNLVGDLERNTRLRTAPSGPASAVYSGVLYGAFDVASLDAAAKRRAARSVVVVSALFGALRLTDRIPAYRVNVCAEVEGVGLLTREWRPLLAPVLDAVVRPRELVVDCRSSTYASLWRPTGDRAAAWVQVAVPGASHLAKFTRGLVARELVSAEAPRTPTALAERLGQRFGVDLAEPVRPGGPWVLSVADQSRAGAHSS
jgi:cytoplasmic iron level regulating protein YaaA (DUF328/UPF0246 family)